jgi:hypothetical protein
LDRLAPPTLAEKPHRPAAPPPGPSLRWLGNRDWYVTIDCTPAGVELHPSGQKFAAAELAPGKGDANPLAAAVQKLIDRRQASVRPGEPPYRPRVRFRVLTGGLRTFHLAYPLLEPLHVPMTRESVEPE